MFSSVMKEAFDLIERCHTIIVSDFRSNLKPFLEKHGKSELSNRDGRIVAQFFSERKDSLRMMQPERSNVRNEILNYGKLCSGKIAFIE
jgi:hypothetical protein